jgi:putative transposase
VIKTLKVRLYPNDEQQVLLEKHFGSCRLVYNHFLDFRSKYYVENKKGLTAFDTMKILTSLKKELVWLNEVNSQSLQHSLITLDKAFKSFFKHNAEYPKFRAKKDNQYFIIPAGFRAHENRLMLPKFKEGIVFRDNSEIPKEIKQVVVTKDVERYYASIQYESNVELQKGNGTVGIDMGIKAFLTTSDGIQIESLNALKTKEKRLIRQQKKLSRKKKGSNNRKKQIVKVQKIYQQIRNWRMDFHHKVSTAIAKQYDTVVIEDLNTQGMMGNHKLAKSISDQGWYQFRQMLEYKLKWRDANLITIGRFEPSSKLCSRCGNIKRDLKLSDRMYYCNACGLEMDRDLNASINIRNMGLIKVGKGIPEFTPVESATAAELSKGGLRVVTL